MSPPLYVASAFCPNASPTFAKLCSFSIEVLWSIFTSKPDFPLFLLSWQLLLSLRQSWLSLPSTGDLHDWPYVFSPPSPLLDNHGLPHSPEWPLTVAPGSVRALAAPGGGSLLQWLLCHWVGKYDLSLGRPRCLCLHPGWLMSTISPGLLLHHDYLELKEQVWVDLERLWRQSYSSVLWISQVRAGYFWVLGGGAAWSVSLGIFTHSVQWYQAPIENCVPALHRRP